MNNIINYECLEIHKKKLEVNKKIDSLLKQKDYNYELIDLKNEEGELLKELNVYIVKLMTYLWDQPKLIANLLLSAEKNDLKENLAPLIANNFYENILSSDYIEDNLLYILSLLLQKEINDLNNENDFSNFLNETPCGFLLGHLKEKKDVQTFFKMIIIKAVEKLEACCSNKDLHFSIGKIDKDIQRQENKGRINDLNCTKNFFLKMTKKKSDIIRSSVDNRDVDMDLEIESELEKSSKSLIIFESKIFKEKYFCCLTKEKIIEEKERYKNENKSDDKDQNEKINKMFDIYINKMPTGEKENQDVVEHYLSKKDKYDNEEFLNGLDTEEKIKKVYIDNFYRVLEAINTIFANIFDNLYLLPYSIKCLCKIIYILIKKKFPNINIIQQNAFLGKFFFDKMLLPFFISPAYEALITNFLISKKTISNLKVISKILLKLISGELYTNDFETNEFTPFNLFFLEKIPDIVKLYDEMKKVNLPNFIEKLLHNKLPEDFKLNYFEENPEEILNQRAICFKIDDINAIIKTIGLNEEMYFDDTKNKGLKKTYEKLCSNSSKLIINEIIQKQTIKKTSSKEQKIYYFKEKKEESPNNKDPNIPKLYFFLISDILINEKYKKTFKLEIKEPNFKIEELKTIENDSQMTQNNLIRVKNSISSILYNYKSLIKKDFPEGTTIDVKSIFNEMKKFTQSNNNYTIDDSIPMQWYLNCLFENLQTIPKEYVENDYELLLNEIEYNIKKEIDLLNFDIISYIHEKINYVKRLKNIFEKKETRLHKVKLNDKANNIIEKISIPIALHFNYKNKILKIEKANVDNRRLQLLDDLVIEDTKKKCMICKTIKIFTNEFPNLTKYQSWQDVDLFELAKTLALPDKLQEYFDIIKEHLQKNKSIIENNLNSISGIIYDYIQGKLYDKIFPKEYKRDDQIFRQCVLLSWIEPKHFINDKKNYIFDGFLPDVNFFLKKLEKYKSPRKKFSYMSKIFESIRNLVKFNGGDEMTGVDDQMPILNYALIKARPLRIYSNCKYMELFLGDRRNKKEDSELIQLLSLCDYICNISYSKLINVTKEEYNDKCNKAAKTDDFKNKKNKNF